MKCERCMGTGRIENPPPREKNVFRTCLWIDCPDCHGTVTKPEQEQDICCNVGEHKCDLIIDLPDHMGDYREARVKAGLSPQICIDKCLENDIKRLWKLGYRTVNSCCGHGKSNSTIIIEFERMQNGKTI